MTRVLVAHASKYGSVEEVARYVGAVLRDRGATCDVVAARQARDLESYDLVVLGTGLYMGRMHREARRFLRHHRDDLAHLPLQSSQWGRSATTRPIRRRYGRSSSGASSAIPSWNPSRRRSSEA
jgi:menaquinone-dependent protoporphyrinogen oxidase